MAMTTPLRQEIYKAVAQAALQAGSLANGRVAADFGCNNGDFLFYLRTQAPQARYFGYDISPAAIEQAQAGEGTRENDLTPAILFRPGSVLDKSLLSPASLDVAFMLGVHPYFDELETVLTNLLTWTRVGGRLFIFGLFNQHPLDIHVTYRHAAPGLAGTPGENGRGWNLFAKAAVSHYLEQAIGLGRHRFTPFHLPYDLPPHPESPIQSWTILDGNGRRWLTNGLSLLMNQELLEVWP